MAFTEQEKQEYGLVGLLPDIRETEDLRLTRVMMQLAQKTTDLDPDLPGLATEPNIESDNALVWRIAELAKEDRKSKPISARYQNVTCRLSSAASFQGSKLRANRRGVAGESQYH